MVAVVHASNSLRNALHYNENKLKTGKAKLIHSMNYGKDTEKLGFTDKIGTLTKRSSLNERTKVNSVHISLNFHPSEKFSPAKLTKIADAYMARLGFGEQPYLVYEHSDAGHPHIHIVTTNIKSDGRAINLHNIGKIRSEEARRAVEKEFHLVRAEGQKKDYLLKPVSIQKVQYGKSETKRAITNVLDEILKTYKYASLPELNAVLRKYNITADRGSEGSRTFKNGGLVFRVLDDKGEKVGVPIKASDIYSKPTLTWLTKRFPINEVAKQPFKQRVKNAIDSALFAHKKMDFTLLAKALEKEKIQLVLRQNTTGLVYGVTYIDHEKKTVFNGSDLGKTYSAKGVEQRFFSPPSQKGEKATATTGEAPAPERKNSNDYLFSGAGTTDIVIPAGPGGLLERALQQEDPETINPELRDDLHKKKRKRRRQRPH